MSKARATTIQQKFGFQDDDLKTSKHDEIMLWLDQNIEKVIAEIIWNEWTIADIDWTPPFGVTLDLDVLPERRAIEIYSKTWEYPLTSGKFVVGFVDMYVEYLCDCIDIRGVGNWEIGQAKKEVYFEIKTAIPSLGELIRQIRLYQQYQDKSLFIVVCPNDRFAEVLRSQGIEFYHYSPDPADVAML